MQSLFDPGVFTLGLAVGVLGLVLLLSLIISYAYEERSLLVLACYLAVMVGFAGLTQRLPVRWPLMQPLLLVAGPAWTAGMLMWLLRNRRFSSIDKAVMSVVALATLALLCFFFTAGPEQGKAGLAPLLSLAWCALLIASSVYLGTQSWDAAGPWKWWLLFGHAAGLVVAMIFLADTAASKKTHWPVVLMLLLQLPPVYLSLVWRSRLLNESRLRSSAAEVIDPLTGLATTPVLIERLMRIMSRVSAAKPTRASSALFLIHVQNWNPLLSELGAEFSEKLLLEAALRLRRSIGDNDMVARIAGGRFAVIAQGLADQGEVAAMATRLVVSGLRLDSPLLPGVELRFRVVVRPLRFARPLTLPAAQEWLVRLAESFAAWPQSHRSRSILVAEDDGVRP
jgi:GGDEF domain-containing protein